MYCDRCHFSLISCSKCNFAEQEIFKLYLIYCTHVKHCTMLSRKYMVKYPILDKEKWAYGQKSMTLELQHG